MCVAKRKLGRQPDSRHLFDQASFRVKALVFNESALKELHPGHGQSPALSCKTVSCTENVVSPIHEERCPGNSPA